MTFAIQSLQRTLSFCTSATTDVVTQHLVAGICFMLTQSLPSWNNFLIKLCDLNWKEARIRQCSHPPVEHLSSFSEEGSVQSRSLCLIFSPACSFLFRAGALVPVLALAVELSVCLKEKELLRSFVPCSACRGGVVAGHLVCLCFLPAGSLQAEIGTKLWSAGCLRDELTQQCKKDLLPCWDLIWLLPAADCRQNPPSDCTGQGLREREHDWLQQLNPMSIYFPLQCLAKPCSCHICHSSHPTEGNPLSLLKQQQIKALFEGCRQANIYFICSVYIHALAYPSKLKRDHLD